MTGSESADAERAVLGDCLFTPSIVRQLVRTLAPEDFEDFRLGNLFSLIVGMVGASGPDAVTPLTVIDETQRRHREGGKGSGTPYPDIATIAGLSAYARPGATAAHARLVRQAAVSRALAAFGRRVASAAEQGTDPAILASQAADEARQIRDGWRTTRLAARPLSEVMAEQDDAYDWLLPGLLERQDRLIITGGEGAGKSTLAKMLGLCLAGGMHPFTAEPIDARTVLVVDCENSERQWRRSARGMVHVIRTVGTADPGENVHLRCMPRMDITAAADLGAVHSMVDDVDPDMVIIGPMYRLVPRAISNDDDAAPVLAALDSIRDRGCALIMEAHAGHALTRGGERDYRPRGSAALMGWPEFGFGLAVDPDDAGRVQVIRWRGDRDERNWPPALRRGGTLPWTDDRQEPSAAEQREYVKGMAS